MVKAFMTIKHGLDDIGTLHLELYDEIVPKTVKNFMALLEGGSSRLTYRNSISHRLIPGFMAQFGDITKGDGTGGESIYGPTFEDENFQVKHIRAGMLSMANSGPNTNGSQFFVTFKPTPHLDDKHVVFGHVDLEQSGHVLKRLERVKTDKGDKPLKPVVVVDCGVVLEEEEMDDNTNVVAEELPTSNANEAEEEIDIDEEEPDEDEANMTKAQKMKARMRKLKMKMNQARQLNQKALRQEGEAMGSEEGRNKQRKQQKWQEKKLQQDAWKAQNARAVKLGEETGVDAKYLVESASSSMVCKFCSVSST